MRVLYALSIGAGVIAAAVLLAAIVGVAWNYVRPLDHRDREFIDVLALGGGVLMVVALLMVVSALIGAFVMGVLPCPDEGETAMECWNREIVR